jgi:hypothetical protein
MSMWLAIMLAAEAPPKSPTDVNYDLLKMAAETWVFCADNQSVEFVLTTGGEANAVAQQAVDACTLERETVRKRAYRYLLGLATEELARDRADAIVEEFRMVTLRKVRERVAGAITKTRSEETYP